MKSYIIISDSADEATLLNQYLNWIPDVTVASMFHCESIQTLSTQSLQSDVIICSVSLMEDAWLQQMHAKHPDTVIVATCNIAQIAIQHPPKEIYGYLASPITYERVFAITQNIEMMLQYRTAAVADRKKDYVFIKSEYKLIKTNYSDILFISGMKDYTQVFVKGRLSPLTTLQNLKEFETKLPADEFVRVHRSYIVSLRQVDVIARNEIMIGTNHIPIGDAYRHALDAIIEENS